MACLVCVCSSGTDGNGILGSESEPLLSESVLPEFWSRVGTGVSAVGVTVGRGVLQSGSEIGQCVCGVASGANRDRESDCVGRDISNVNGIRCGFMGTNFLRNVRFRRVHDRSHQHGQCTG